MSDSVQEYKLMIPVLVNRGDSLVDRNVVLGVLWLVSVLVFVIPLWIMLTADLPFGLKMGIFIGIQLAGLLVYIPLLLCYKNRGFLAVSEGDLFSWAIYRRRAVLWSSVTGASIISAGNRVGETPSISFHLEVDGMRKPVKLHMEAGSGELFKEELKQRTIHY
ncbi:MAG: hypothetical protein J7K88_01840 [Candidatus Fermentibacteraceae bacterium]|nr:hypothetical protein [Candidatus Fermentibacteraceae bacterium]